MSNADDWKIPVGNESCAGCGEALVPHAMVTVVLRLEGDGPARQDLCEACGEKVESGGGAYFWRHRRPEGEDRRPVVDYAVLREVFERMLEREEEVYRRLCYLVGLVLVRKRHLRLRRFEVRDGREVMVVSRSVDAPELIVPAPYLSAEDMLATRNALTRLLSADLTDGELDLTVVTTESEAEPGSDDASLDEPGSDGAADPRDRDGDSEPEAASHGASAEEGADNGPFGPRPELN